MDSLVSQISRIDKNRYPREEKSRMKSQLITKKLNFRKLFVAMNSSSKIHLDKPIPDQFAIWDVDKTLALGTLFIITPQRLNNKRILAIKCFILILMITFCFKTLLLSLIDPTLEENRHLIFILGDPTLFLSGLREFTLIALFLTFSSLAYINYSFNFTEHMPWLEIFRFLEGKTCYTPRQMGITEVELVKEIIARYKLLIYGSVIEIPIVMTILGISAPFVFWFKCRDLREFLLMLSWLPYYGLMFYIVFASTCVTLIYFYISSYYITLKARLYNEKVDRILFGPYSVRKFTTKLEIRSMIKDHANICVNIFQSNAFWGNLYSIGLIVCLPLNLIAINLLIFTPMNFFTIFFYLFACIFAWIFIFWVDFVMAVVHHQVTKTYKKLCKLQWKFNNISIGFKIKVT